MLSKPSTCLVLLIGTLSSCGPDPKAADRHVRQARALIERQNYDLALQELASALAADPKHLHARFHKAEVLFNQAKLTEAGEIFEALSRDYPGDNNTRLGLAYVRRDQGRHKEALNLLAALQFDPKNIPSMIECMLKIDGRERDAANLAAELLANDPWHQKAYLLFSQAETKRKREASAKLWGDTYREKEPIREANAQARGLASQGRMAESALAFGRNLYKSGRYFDAMRELNKAVGINPKLAPAFVTMGRILKAVGRSKDAVKSFKRALEISDKKHWQTRLTEAEAQVAAEGDKEKTALQWARKYAAEENYDLARAAALFEAKRAPKNVEALRAVGTYFNRPGDLFVQLWAWRIAGDIPNQREEFKRYIGKACVQLKVDLLPPEPRKGPGRGQPAGNGRPGK